MRTSIALSFFFLFSTLNLSAQDCALGWDFYRSVTIDNTAGEALSGYQVSFTLNTAALVAAGKLQADGADLRVFASDCTPLPFWGDSLGTTTDTRIFVKVPTLAAGASLELQVYYGEAVAESATDGDNTFLFFDDFEGDEVDVDKWEAIGEYDQFRVLDGRFHYASTGMIPGGRFKFARTKAAFSEQVIYDFVIERSNAEGFGLSSAAVDLDRFIFRSASMGFDTLVQIAVMDDTLNNGMANTDLYPVLRFDEGEFYTVSFTPHINPQNQVVFTRFANETLGDVNLDTMIMPFVNMSACHFIVSSFGSNQVVEMDNIRVRQHTDVPPSARVSAEMNATPTNVGNLITPERVAIYPNPSDDYVMIGVDWHKAVEVQIRDTYGHLFPVSVVLRNATPQLLSLGELPAGMYYLQLRQLDNNLLLQSRQLVISRN